MDLTSSVEAPFLPQGVVLGLKVDPNTQKVGIDQEALMTMLKGLRSYSKELAEHAISMMRDDLEAETRTMREEVRLAVEELRNDMDRKNIPRFEALEESVEHTHNETTEFRQEITAMHARVMQATELAEKGANKANTEQPRSAKPPERPADMATTVQLDIVAGRVERVNDALVEKVNTDLGEVRQYLESEMRLIKRWTEDGLAQVKAVEQAAEALRERVQTVETQTAGVSEHVGKAMGEMADASAMRDVQEQLASLSKLAEAVGALPDLEARMQRQELITADASSTKDVVNMLHQQAEAGKSALDHLSTRLEDARREALAAADQVDTKVAHRHDVIDASLAHHEDKLNRHLSALHPRLAKLEQTTSTMVHRPEFLTVREHVGTISQQLQEKEQTVLFGARCLSCNRVFDDVQTQAGTVDLHGDKQRAMLWAEMQRALYGPKTDPESAVKMIAVQVGRPAALPAKGGAGTFEGRQKHLSCSVEDLALMKPPASAVLSPPPPPSTDIFNSTFNSALSSTMTQPVAVPPASPPPGSPRKRREPLPLQSPGASALLGSGLRSGTTDFRHPISHLVGRKS
mmetsp:Transcript_31388/g.73232  ORF Transcript_31388/g.73232 Transcript_31388/m.73232 type:complete len:575 (-) Transcript_31388:183-1907(-)